VYLESNYSPVFDPQGNLVSYLSVSRDISEMVTDAETATVRAKGVTQQLLSFVKGGTPIKKPTSISALIRDTAEFSLSGSNVGCEFSIVDDLWVVEVDKGQIGQVIHNVVINADQAMPTGGTIKKLRKIDPGAKAIVSSGYSDDRVLSKFEEYGFCGAVTKPYKIDDLAELIHKAVSDLDRD
jgi:hypothetical protein